MNPKQLATIARTLAKQIGGHVPTIGRCVPQAEYLAAETASYQATNSARYIAEHYATRADHRAAFLNACGLRAEARAAQLGLPVAVALA